jgi:Ca2+-binding EF-hand superfamily protein
VDKSELMDITKAFKELDKNHDGKLSLQEIFEGYSFYFNGEISRQEVDKIFMRVDADGSKYVDYSEWVVATINKEKLLAVEQLEYAFSLFDKDGSGSISADEIK